MKIFVNVIIILIGALLLICSIFADTLSHEGSGWVGFAGFVFVFLGWCYNTIEDK